MKKKLFFACILMIVCLSLVACSGFTSNNGNSSNTNTDSNIGSNDGTNNQPTEDNDGTFIYMGSSIKAASTSISGAIVIPSEHNGTPIESVPSGAFKGCTSITSIEVPKSVTSIGEGAFSGCSTLRSIALPFVGSQKGNSDTTAASFGYIFGTDSYQGGTSTRQFYRPGDFSRRDYYIPSALRTVTITNESVLAYHAFGNCSMLTKINLNDGIIQVGVYCFANCSRIEEINLPNISIIPSSLFYGCISLSKFTINNSVDTIGESAFSGCSSLSSINSKTNGEFIIPNTVLSIGESAFNGCSMVKSITLPFVGSQKGNSGSYSSCFGYIFGTDSYQGGTSTRQFYRPGDFSRRDYYIPSALRTITITNESVIAYGAFQNCSMLTSITINSGAKNQVGEKAFENTVAPTWID